MKPQQINAGSYPMTTKSICDFHYKSDVSGFYASNKEYSNMIKADFKSVVSKCIHTLPKDDCSIELEHYGSTVYNISQSSNKNAFNELVSRINRITFPPDANSVNIELNSRELELAWILIHSIPHLYESIERHLGGTFVVQEAYHFITKNYNQDSKINTSGFWHRDSCGRRIKIFICLDTTQDSPLTAVLPCTYLDPIPREWEMLRASVSSKADNNISTIQLNELNQTFKQLRPIERGYNTGDIVLLDTNAVHRGIYKGNATNSYRHLLQISLIPKATLDIQRMLHKIVWAQADVKYPNSLFKLIPLHTPPFYPDKQ